MTKIYSVRGLLPSGQPLVRERPFRAPHHTVSYAGLVGGGSLAATGRDQPGASRRAVPGRAAGVRRGDAGGAAPAAGGPHRHDLARQRRVTFPANFMLVAAMNPCPCGH